MPHQEFYFHGTNASSAYRIMTGGFSISKEQVTHGRVKGDGVYIAHDRMNALNWGDYIVKCKLKSGTKVAWLDGKYDKRIIKSLSKEFGHDLLKVENVFKIIPSNKHFTGDELLAFCNYVYETRFKNVCKHTKWEEKKWVDLKHLNRLLRRHKFGGVGEKNDLVWDGDEVLVFNPSDVIPVSVNLLVCQFKYWASNEIKIISDKQLSMDDLKARAKQQELDWEQLGFKIGP